MGETEPIVVEKWDGNAVKNALDDAVRKIFTEELGYVERNTFVDVRLALSTLGCFVALLALAYDYLYPFPLSKYILVGCVASYFMLMSILTLFMTFVEKNIILLAAQRDPARMDPDTVWQISTTLKRFEDQYSIEIDVTDGVSKQKRSVILTQSVATWFTVDGELLYDKLKGNVISQQKSLLADKKDN